MSCRTTRDGGPRGRAKSVTLSMSKRYKHCSFFAWYNDMLKTELHVFSKACNPLPRPLHPVCDIPRVFNIAGPTLRIANPLKRRMQNRKVDLH
jgi:hypothetical protein